MIDNAGVRFNATFYTLANLHSLFEKNAATGECLAALFAEGDIE